MPLGAGAPMAARSSGNSGYLSMSRLGLYTHGFPMPQLADAGAGAGPDTSDASTAEAGPGTNDAFTTISPDFAWT